MLPNTLEIFSAIQTNSYILIFILMLIEGPIVTSLAAFGASLGYLNIYAIIMLSLFGNLIPDIILFIIGRFGRKKSIENYISNLGIKYPKIKKLEIALKNHSGKALIFSKLTPPLPLPGIILAGFVKMPFKKFLIIDLIFNITATIIFAGIGFYFGFTIDKLFEYIQIGQYAFLAIIPMAIIVYFAYKKIFSKFSKELDIKNEKK
jgi:membrane protein DedA with SNARE-associated domain